MGKKSKKSRNSNSSTPQDLIQAVFTLSRLWEKTFDQTFASDGITVKQFFLMAALDRSTRPAPPTLGEAADDLLMSYQNVKKLALQLEQRGFVQLIRDENDRRVLRIHTTEASRNYWASRSSNDETAFKSLFRKLSDQRIDKTCKNLARLIKNAESAASGGRAGPPAEGKTRKPIENRSGK
ncbi:MAG: MarR family transcriptional regulator [Spirochaetaceae bacterium]|nr:MarR family transcriptional regulator [Spirochaetaceae bacterium]MDT8298227.1 MarR family transcriptional regulator [Spirochaetaceae bacterium]